MTQEQLIQSFHASLLIDVNDAARAGLPPAHIADLLLIASLEIAVAIHGVAEAKAGLLLAADNIGGDA
ncbi:MAG: hypothetical protein CVT85_04595 [Alphaproteobacteria bacterium HGW-Alphaproteobacteria-7]|jgi:hypothetical protein|nr:MAG: hypothetical protein CVT85_04595 [Alphaproteobacteria bacterium HGW-Alphaproteobacteria-7]